MNKRLFCIGLLCVLCSAVRADVKSTPVNLQTRDNWDIAASYVAAQPGKKTVVLLHDVGKNRSAFGSFSVKLADRGIGYLALDLRGHGKSVQQGIYTSFAKEGVDNDYNKMTRDVDAAMEFLSKRGVAEENIVFLGAGMGANVAAKAASLWPGVGGVALLTPVTNFRDVLPIPALRVYKGLVFIAAAADDKKTFLEASVLRNVAFLTAGEGRVVFATAYDKKGHELLDAWAAPEVLQWLQTPLKPELLPDAEPETEVFVPQDSTLSDTAQELQDLPGGFIPPETQGENLAPSILWE